MNRIVVTGFRLNHGVGCVGGWGNFRTDGVKKNKSSFEFKAFPYTPWITEQYCL